MVLERSIVPDWSIVLVVTHENERKAAVRGFDWGMHSSLLQQYVKGMAIRQLG